MDFRFKDENTNNNNEKVSPQQVGESKQNETYVPNVSIKAEDESRQTSAEEKVNRQVLQHKQQVGEQTNAKRNKHAKKNQSVLRETGRDFLRGGVLLSALGGSLLASGVFYTPLGIFSSYGIIAATIGLPVILGGGVMWIAGLISEALHNHNISKALKQAERKSKEEDTIEWI